MLIFRMDSNLIVSGETVEEGENLITSTLIDNLVYKWCGVIIFRTCFIKVSEINANSNCSLFFIHGNKILNPLCQRNRENKSHLEQLLHLDLIAAAFLGLTR